MVVGAPPPAAVASALAGFAEDSVLVGHHLRFDLGFLLRQRLRAMRPCWVSRRWTRCCYRPSSSTTATAAIAWTRCRSGLGLDRGRHSALGDALGTAEVLVRMIPLLAARGIHTPGEAQEASAATALARRIDSQIPRVSGAPRRGADR